MGKKDQPAGVTVVNNTSLGCGRMLFWFLVFGALVFYLATKTCTTVGGTIWEESKKAVEEREAREKAEGERAAEAQSREIGGEQAGDVGPEEKNQSSD